MLLGLHKVRWERQFILQVNDKEFEILRSTYFILANWDSFSFYKHQLYVPLLHTVLLLEEGLGPSPLGLHWTGWGLQMSSFTWFHHLH